MIDIHKLILLKKVYLYMSIIYCFLTNRFMSKKSQQMIKKKP